MDIRAIFEAYSKKISYLYLYQRAIKSIAKKEFDELIKNEEAIKKRPDLSLYSSSYHNMSFRDAKHGEHIFFGSFERTIEDRKISVLLHKNKQYQWLLAEAYEEFKDFIETAYAYAGYKDSDYWPLKDFGNSSLSELKRKSFSWFIEMASSKKETPNSIIHIFKKKFSDLARIEIDNSLNINLRFAIVLIELFRHIIVHNGGRVKNKDLFIKRVMKKSGLYNNGKYEDSAVQFINQFFGIDEYSNTIMLLEVRVNLEFPVDMHRNLFEQLSGYLLAYAHLIYDELTEKYVKKSRRKFRVVPNRKGSRKIHQYKFRRKTV